jgi:hypothetical protein
MSIPVPFTENLLQPDIPNEVDKVCVVKTRKQSTGENTWTPWNKKSNADKISSHLAILPLGSFKLKSQIKAW